MRLTPSRPASSRSGGRRSPRASPPAAIRSRSQASICAWAGPRPGLTVFAHGPPADFAPPGLRDHCYCGADTRTTQRRLWDATVALPSLRYDEVAAGGDGLRRWLAFVDELGFAVLTGGPTEPETVTRVT